MYKLELNKYCIHWVFRADIHRDNDLPATEYFNGTKAWYQDGLRHRTTGPAVIGCNHGDEYWVNGKLLTPEQWYDRVHS